jgi:hypothetical protein
MQILIMDVGLKICMIIISKVFHYLKKKHSYKNIILKKTMILTLSKIKNLTMKIDKINNFIKLIKNMIEYRESKK